MKRQLLIDYRGNRTQEEMGRQYGVTQQIWSRWENGIQKPKTITMKRLEDAIGRPMEEIFFDVFYPLKVYQHTQKERSTGTPLKSTTADTQPNKHCP